MKRSYEAEILDGDGIDPAVVEAAHRDLLRTHKLLGNLAFLVKMLRRDSLPIRRVLDVGCGHGGLLKEIGRRLGAETVGVDLKPPGRAGIAPFPILRADATRDALPEADVAISVCLAHHLVDDDLIALIHNVGRSCRRFVVLDLIRHRIPLVVFRVVAPALVSKVNVADGCLSIRRAYTTREFRKTVERALAGSGATWRHKVSPLLIRQVADIRYRQ